LLGEIVAYAHAASYDLPHLYRFHGIEDVTIELAGSFDPARLEVPSCIELERDAGGRARVSLFAFAVRRIRITGVPLIRASYPELLWRIAVRDGGAPAWWALACDLGARGPRIAARRWVRYPVRAQMVAVTAERISATGPAGDLAIRLGPAAETTAIDVRPLITGRDASWLVPWGDDAGEVQVSPAVVDVERDSLGEATVGSAIAWEHAACIRRGRRHRCGVARRR
jgi:hypothetical protein